MDIQVVLIITLAVLNLVLLASIIYMFVKNMGRAQLFSMLKKRGSNSTLPQRQLDAQRPNRLVRNIQTWDAEINNYNDPAILSDIHLNVINANTNVTRRPDIYGSQSSQLISDLRRLETKIHNKTRIQ